MGRRQDRSAFAAREIQALLLRLLSSSASPATPSPPLLVRGQQSDKRARAPGEGAYFKVPPCFQGAASLSELFRRPSRLQRIDKRFALEYCLTIRARRSAEEPSAGDRRSRAPQ